MTTLELPYPPSANCYFSFYRGRPILSQETRDYRQTVRKRLREAGISPASGPLAVDVEVFPPDRRRRDVDNVLKSLLDALEYGGAFHDDSQVMDLRARKSQPTAGGKVIVKIQATDDQDAKSCDPM